jgi:hypothetical protein
MQKVQQLWAAFPTLNIQVGTMHACTDTGGLCCSTVTDSRLHMMLPRCGSTGLCRHQQQQQEQFDADVANNLPLYALNIQVSGFARAAG